MPVADARTQRSIGALMERALIADPSQAGAKLVAGLLRNVCPCQIWAGQDAARVMELAQLTEPHVIFIDHGMAIDGIALTRQIRRSDLGCRKAPVIMLSGLATAAAILGARDAGVHEFLRKPFTIRDLVRRLSAVAERPRDWVEAIGYVGPDRRRFNSGDYAGPLKRRVDYAVTPDEARVEQALRIMRAALLAIEADPRQALRALIAQTDELATSVRARSDMPFRAAAVSLNQGLQAMRPGTLTRAAVEPLANRILAFHPQDSAAA